MRHTVVISTLLALSLPGTVATAAKPSREWYRNLAEAQQVARATRKPLFVLFRCET